LYESDLDTPSHFARLSDPLPSLHNSQSMTWQPVTNMTNQGTSFEKEGSRLVVRNGSNVSGTFAFREETMEVVKLDAHGGLLSDPNRGWVGCELHFCI
jgi:hypothetical protein